MGKDKKEIFYEQWVDIFKGFLIILVVAGHGYYQKMNDIIFWFHMPLFFLISGYLFKTPERKNIKSWCFKQMKSLLIPCAFFYVINMALAFDHASVVDITKKAILFIYGGRMLPGVYWFITCLLLSRIIMALIEIYVDSEKVKVAIYIGMYALAVIESNTMIPNGIYYYPNVPLYCLIPWNADVCLFAVPFMAIGKYVKGSLLKNRIASQKNIEQVLPIVAIAVLVLFGTLQICNYYSVEINMKYVHYSNLVLCVVLPLATGVVLKTVAIALATGGGTQLQRCVRLEKPVW